MGVKINSETTNWTDIVFLSANYETLFDGVLKKIRSEWVLCENQNGCLNAVHKYASTRTYASALAASIKWVEANRCVYL